MCRARRYAKLMAELTDVRLHALRAGARRDYLLITAHTAIAGDEELSHASRARENGRAYDVRSLRLIDVRAQVAGGDVRAVPLNVSRRVRRDAQRDVGKPAAACGTFGKQGLGVLAEAVAVHPAAAASREAIICGNRGARVRAAV